MLMVTTDIGLAAIRSAESGGFLLSLRTFSVSGERTAVPSVQSVALAGTPTFKAEIQSIEAVGQNSIKATLVIPPGWPASGPSEIYEVGLYLTTGELFAHGTLTDPFVKTGEYALKIVVYVTAARLGEVINVTETNLFDLPSVVGVHALVPPTRSNATTVVVLDQQTTVEGADLGSLAIKSGASGLDWSFVGYNRVVRDVPDAVPNFKQFSMTVGLRRAWLNDGEIVICHIVAGAGAGASRRCVYKKATNTFVAQKRDWSLIDTSSVISIWRKDSVALPERKPSTPQYMCLGIGRTPSAASYDDTAPTRGIRIQRHYLPTPMFSPLGFTVPAAGVTVPDTVGRVLVFAQIDAPAAEELTQVVRLTTDQWSYDRDNATIYVAPGLAGCVALDVLAFVDDDLGVPGTVFIQEAVYQAGSTVRSTFDLPMVLASSEQALLFVEGRLQPRSNYTLINGGATLQVSVPTVHEVRIVVMAEEQVDGAYGSCALFGSGPLPAAAQTFELPIQTSSINYTLALLDGTVLPRSAYRVLGSTMTMTSVIEAGHDLQVLCFGYSYASAVRDLSERLDTGPVWTDPAGVDSLPNKLQPLRFQYVADGANNTYDVPGVDNVESLLVFAQGQQQPPSTYTLSDSTLITEVFRAGHLVDIVALVRVDHEGSTATIHRNRSVINSSPYVHPLGGTVDIEQGLLVFIDGVFQHIMSYGLAPTKDRIVVGEAPIGSTIETWCFSTRDEQTSRTRFGWVSRTATSSSFTIDLDFKVEDVMVLFDSIWMHSDKYSVWTSGGKTFIQFNNVPANLVGRPVDVRWTQSGLPLTRLMKRDEALELFALKGDVPTTVGEPAGAVAAHEQSFDHTAFATRAASNAYLPLAGGRLNGMLVGKGGAGGPGNPNSCGFAFDTDNGSVDTGMFSPSDGVLDLYCNGELVARLTNGLATFFRNLRVQGDITADVSLFSATRAFAENDAVRLPNGLILQWGKVTVNKGGDDVAVNVTFPTAFPNAALSVNTFCIEADNAYSEGYTNLTRTGCTLQFGTLGALGSAGSVSIAGYLAIGY